MTSPSSGQSSNRWLNTACRITLLVGILNFTVFVMIACFLGGDAVNGKVDGGHYFLYGVRSDHGYKVYTEVSEAVFSYSKWHSYSTMATWPFVMAAAYVLNRAKRHRIVLNRR